MNRRSFFSRTVGALAAAVLPWSRPKLQAIAFHPEAFSMVGSHIQRAMYLQRLYNAQLSQQMELLQMERKAPYAM